VIDKSNSEKIAKSVDAVWVAEFTPEDYCNRLKDLQPEGWVLIGLPLKIRDVIVAMLIREKQ